MTQENGAIPVNARPGKRPWEGWQQPTPEEAARSLAEFEANYPPTPPAEVERRLVLAEQDRRRAAGLPAKHPWE
jgi:hypothetical protein